MENEKVFVLFGHVEDRLVPAVDNAIAQLLAGFIGLRNKAASERYNPFIRSEAIGFAADFGFIGRFVLTTNAKRDVEIRGGFGHSIINREGTKSLDKEKTSFYFPKNVELAGQTLGNALEILGRGDNFRAAVKEGLATVTQEQFDQLLDLARKTSMGRWEEVKYMRQFLATSLPLQANPRTQLEADLHQARDEVRLIYQSEKNKPVTLKVSARGTAEDAAFSFVGGLFDYHQAKAKKSNDNEAKKRFKEAAERFSEVWQKEPRYPWVEEALNQSLFAYEGDRGFKGNDASVALLYRDVLRASRAERYTANDEKLKRSPLVPILIVGERGTGKGLVAREVHKYSGYDEDKYTSLDLGAMDVALANSELFGHVKGAFTGAVKNHEGVLQRAHGGTLLLDEVGNASKEVQKKLLQFLQTGGYYRIGDDKLQHSNARVICATNRDLPRMVDEGEFMPDLYDRLATFVIHIQPLRKRIKDALSFLETTLDEVKLSKDAKDALMKHDWPGNYRELEAVRDRLMALNKPFIFREEVESVLNARTGLNDILGGYGFNLDMTPWPDFLDQVKKDLAIKYLCHHYKKHDRNWEKTLKAVARGSRSDNLKNQLHKMVVTENLIKNNC